jgi:hypothetical protein
VAVRLDGVRILHEEGPCYDTPGTSTTSKSQ